MNTNDGEIFDFPCDYPIKVLGKDCANLRPKICAIIEKYTAKLTPNQITVNRSSKGNYVAFTVRIVATSRTQLNGINQALQNCDLVSYIL